MRELRYDTNCDVACLTTDTSINTAWYHVAAGGHIAVRDLKSVPRKRVRFDSRPRHHFTNTLTHPTSNDVSTIMAKGSGVFFQEVEDAIKNNPPDVGDLIVLRDLCIAVDAGDQFRASGLVDDLVKLDGVEDPLHSISYKVFHSLMARVLLPGWFKEFDLLIHWDLSLFSSRDGRTATNWEGVLQTVSEPGPVGLSSLFIPNVFLLLDREGQWQRALNGLEGAFRHLAKVRLPSDDAPPRGVPSFYDPASGISDPRDWALSNILQDAVELFFRLLQMIFQQTLELALKQLQRDGDPQFFRRLQEMQESLAVILDAQRKLYRVSVSSASVALLEAYRKDREVYGRLRRGLFKVIRVAEFRYGSANKHRFLDAFPYHQARSVVFHSLDREDKERPHIRGERLGNIHLLRDRQIAFYLILYGHPVVPTETPNDFQKRRRALIKRKHSGGLDLTNNDHLIAFLTNVFEDELTELTRAGPQALSRDAASLKAWVTIVELWGACFSNLTSHSRLNLTEGPPNYLTHAFPRNLGGRLLHDCGVYAVRSAYVLLSALEHINRLHGEVAGAVQARWVLLPLHVGVLIEIGKFGLLVQHNDNVSVFDGKQLAEIRKKWLEDRLIDPSGPDEEPPLKLHEDIAASAFGSDLDMPIRSIPLLDPGQPVTIQTIWTSYQLKVVQAKLFTGIVGNRNAKQYQFDNRYLRVSEQEREWYNEVVLPFWNDACNQMWRKWESKLKRNDARLPEYKKDYTDDLLKVMFVVVNDYSKKILPEKRQLTKDLRQDSKLLLMPGVRIVESMRLKTDLAAVERIKKHIDDVIDPLFKFKPDFVPPFAKPEERLIEVP